MPVDPATGTAGAPQPVMPAAMFGPHFLYGGVRYSPDGKRVLSVTGNRTIVIRSLADGSEHTVAPQLAALGAVEWAADSGSLLVSGTTADGKEGVYQVDLQSGAATWLFAKSNVRQMAPSPDGKTLYYRAWGVDRRPVVVRDLETGAERNLLEKDLNIFYLKMSRDGKRLAVVARRALLFVDVATGEVKTRYQASGKPDLMGGDWSPDGQRFLVFGHFDHPHRFELWTFTGHSGEPARQRLAGDYRGASMSADGRHLATLKWEQRKQVWVLENFLPGGAGNSQ